MVSVVIPAREPSFRLKRCLEALRHQTAKPFEVVVVFSDAHTPFTFSHSAFRVISAVCSPPASFSRAVNQGISKTQGEWILLLNDDVVLEKTFLEKLLQHIPSDERIGMVCGKLLSADGHTIDSTGQFVARQRTAFERGHGDLDRGQYDTPGYVFSAPGAAAFYRRAMLMSLSRESCIFDEDLGMYLEDLDLGWRAQREGWRAYYVPAARARHERGASAKTHPPKWPWLRRYYLPWLSPELQARFIVNRYKLISRYDSVASFLKHSLWIVGYEAKLWTYLVLTQQKVLRLLWIQFVLRSPR